MQDARLFRKMRVTSCEVCDRLNDRCRWKKRLFYATAIAGQGKCPVWKFLDRWNTAAGKQSVHRQDYNERVPGAVPMIQGHGFRQGR